MSDVQTPPPSWGLAVPDPIAEDAPRGRGAPSFLMDAVRLRPVGRRLLSMLTLGLLLVGAGMFVYPLVTDVYTEQVLLPRLETVYREPEFREQYVTRTIAAGDPLTRISIPKIGVDAVVVQGTSAAALRAGAGHYPTTPLPGEPGNVAIAGHRTTYGKPFNQIDEVGVGEIIVLETPLAVHTYRVVAAPAGVEAPCPNGACWITTPTDWGVVGPLDGSFLTLTSCHPKGSARQRIILRAQLESSVPVTPQPGPPVPVG